MLSQANAIRVFVFTLITGEGVFPWMLAPHMFSQLTAGGQQFVTYRTFVFSVSTMDYHVSSKVVILYESFIANFTFEFPVISMVLHMINQTAALGEHLSK